MFNQAYNGFYPYSNFGAGMNGNMAARMGGGFASGMGTGFPRGMGSGISGGMGRGLASGPAARGGILSRLLGKGINWSGLLNNTQKTLNIINQAIPVAYQIKPIWNNTKTIFKVIGAIKDDGTSTSTRSSNNKTTTSKVENNENIKTEDSNTNQPSFFL